MIDAGSRAYLKDRDTLGHFAQKTIGKGEMDVYRQTKNVRSLDGCPGLRVARRQKGEYMLLEDGLAWLKRVASQWDAILVGAVLAVVMMLLSRVVPLPDGIGMTTSKVKVLIE